MYSNLTTFEVEKSTPLPRQRAPPPFEIISSISNQNTFPPPFLAIILIIIHLHLFIVAREGLETPNRMIRSQTPSHLANVLLVNLQAVYFYNYTNL